MTAPNSKTGDHIPIPRKRKTLVWRIGRILLVFVILLVLLVAIGLLYQSIASAVDASMYPPSGRLIDVGGYRLHINCTGRTSAGQPTVILEAQLGGNSLDWQALQNDLASLSTNSTHIIATHSGHDIIFERPDLVIAAIKQMVTGQKP